MMNDLIQWGLLVVQWIQGFRNPLLDQFFLTINFLGDEDFYLLFLPLLFWCLDRRLGARLGVLFLFSMYTNQFLKDWFRAPRPYQADGKIYSPVRQPGYGIPSAHAQGTTTTWGYLATQLRTIQWWILAVAVPLLISIGRMYLGDHFPQDVIAGLAIGTLLIGMYLVIEPPVEKWIVRQSAAAKLALVIFIPLAFATVHLTMDTAVVIGTFLGLYSGLVLEEDLLHFNPRNIWWKQIFKLAIGLGVVLGIRVGLKAILPPTAIFNMVRYIVVGLWVGIGAPWLFCLTHLAQMDSSGAIDYSRTERTHIA